MCKNYKLDWLLHTDTLHKGPKATFKVDMNSNCELRVVSTPLYATTLEQNQMDVHHAGNFPQQLHEQQFPLAYSRPPG